MDAQVYYEKIIRKLRSAVEKDSRISKVLKSIKAGKCTHRETFMFADTYSAIMGQLLAELIPDMSEVGLREQVCTMLLNDSHKEINAIASDVQKSLDERSGVDLAPRKGSFPKERIAKVAHSLEDRTVPLETVQRRAEKAVSGVSRSFHDDFIKENAEYRAKAGFKCYITRIAVGKCCDWCASLEGRYEYGKEPEEVYHRHDSCSCITTYESGRLRRDVWNPNNEWQVSGSPPEEKDDVAPTVLTPEQSRTIEEKSAQKLGLT